MRIRELREKRNRLATEARAILDACEQEKRGMNTEEQAKFEKLHKEIELAKTEIDAEERQTALELELRQPIDRRSGREPFGLSSDPTENKELERRAFAAWMRGGNEGMTDEQRSVMAGLRRNDPELRALGSGNSAGGYTIPSATRAEVINAMKAFGGMRRTRAQVITTEGGGPLHFPTNDDTGNVGALLSENAQAAEQDTTFGDVQLDGYIYTSKVIRVPYTLLQDSGVDIEAYVRQILAERLGRITETHFATGDGSSKPRGVTVAAADSSVQPDISSGLTVANLVDIKHSIDPAHRENAEWMFSDSFLKLILGLSFTSSMPWGIWVPSARDGDPDTILGRPYVVNNSMPSAGTATNRAVCFGDFSYYKIRDVRDIMMMRLTERWADYFQVGFIGFLRLDGDLVDPGSNPVKYAAMQA